MRNSQLPFRKFAGVSLLLAFMFLFVTSCNKEENVQPQPEEDLPDLITMLESFDEEVEYREFGENERRGGKWIKRQPTFFTLADALKYTGLFVPVVKEKLTVFAPTDEAFREIGINFWNVWRQDKDFLTSVILYHAAPGFIFARDLPDCSLEMLDGSYTGFNFDNGDVFINDATDEFAQVIFTDKRALNSVFHGIDKVLIPPTETIAGIASGNPDFSILVSLLVAADLVDVVADPDQNLTVFAPTNAAFEDLLAGVAPFDLLGYFEEYPEELTNVLLHHVAGGSTFSFCLADGQGIPTLNGDNLTVDLGDLELISSSGNEVGLIPSLLDIHATNGVIHAIDAVLIPDNLDLTKPVPRP
jgi:transforming growth factor-beta-induced protein